MKKATASLRNCTPSSQERCKSKQDESVTLIGKIKAELSSHIAALQKFKASVINPAICQMELGLKSKLRIQIENFLIELNEEMFNISNALAKAFSSNELPSKPKMAKKAKEFEIRKNLLLKKIHKGIQESAPPKIAILYSTSRSRSTSPALPRG